MSEFADPQAHHQVGAKLARWEGLGKAERDILRTQFYLAPTRPDNPKALASRPRPGVQVSESDWESDMGTAILLDRQPDGSYVALVDLDGHIESQDPERALATLRERAGPALAQCFVKRSTSNTGYHILIRVTHDLPHNQPIYIDGVHVGELLCMHCPLVGEPVSGDLLALPILPQPLVDLLFSVVRYQHSTRDPISWTARSREGMRLIRGYQEVKTARFRGADGIPKSFQGSTRSHTFARTNWHRLQHAQVRERSNFFATYVQSVALLATDAYGSTIAERCRTIAAIVIEDCPKLDDTDYRVEKDVAALLARIIHGDPYRGRDGHFLIPYWAQAYKPPATPSRRSGRPAGSWKTRLAALRNFLLQHAEGAHVEHILVKRSRVKLTVAALAAQLAVSERTIRRDLAQLEAQHEIIREESSGRNGQLVIVFLPSFGHAVDDATLRPQRQMRPTTV